jgi:hypothetical protein
MRSGTPAGLIAKISQTANRRFKNRYSSAFQNQPANGRRILRIVMIDKRHRALVSDSSMKNGRRYLELPSLRLLKVGAGDRFSCVMTVDDLVLLRDLRA